MRTHLTIFAALAMIACVLLARQVPAYFDTASQVTVLLVVLLGLGRTGLREKYLLAISILLALALWKLHPQPIAALQSALGQAGFLMSFILLLGMLYQAALRSPSIAECGSYLTRQPPGRRYNALYLGTGMMSVLFNLGVISLLTPLIQNGVRTANPEDPLNPVRERRQLTAVLRGFAWGIIWSPTALAPLTLLDLMPGIERGRWIAVGFIIASIVMVIGWLEDRIRFWKLKPGRRSRRPNPAPVKALLLFFAAFCWLLSLALLMSRLSEDSIVYGLMVACPVMMAGWLLAQHSGQGANTLAATKSAIGEILFSGLPAVIPVSITLACAGFIGKAAAALVAPDRFADLIGIYQMPNYLFLSLVPLAITIASWFALSPIVAAVFLGSVFGSLPALPIDPTLLAISISCGWALAMTSSPIVTLVLLMASNSGHSGVTLSWRWNTAFSISCVGLIFVCFWILTGGR